jgi:hypothetical protein
MCYTETDSLFGYIINSISSIFLFTIANDSQFKVISLFLLFVGQMQIFDYTFFKNQTCNLTNKVATKGAIIFNHLQPVVLYLLQTFYGFRQSIISSIILGLYILVGIFYNYNALLNVNCTLPVKVHTDELKKGIMKNIMDWKWNNLNGYIINNSLFLLYLISASFNFTDIHVKIFTALASIITILVATKTPILNLSIGRIWCYYAALMPVIFIGLYYYIQSK